MPARRRCPVTLLRVRAIRRFTVRTVLPAALEPLDELAHNLRWSWHPPTSNLFSAIDPKLWVDADGDPVALLGALGSERLEALAKDEGFVGAVNVAADDLHRYLNEPRWYQGTGADLPAAIGYFSPEFGVTSAVSYTHLTLPTILRV